jgi:hypothetical protein
VEDIAEGEGGEEEEVEIIDWEKLATPTPAATLTPKVKDAAGKKGKKSYKDMIPRLDKWEEAKGAKYKPGKGVDVKSIRKLDPRPCHT